MRYRVECWMSRESCLRGDAAVKVVYVRADDLDRAEERVQR